MKMPIAGRISFCYAFFWSTLTTVILLYTLPLLNHKCSAKIVPDPPTPTPITSISPPGLSPSTPVTSSPPSESLPPTPKNSLLNCQKEAEKSGQIKENQIANIPSTKQGITLMVEMPAQTCTQSIEISGKISQSTFTPAKQYNVAFVIDVSSSTRDNKFTGQEQIGDLNNDGYSDTILDSEVAAFLALTQSIIDAKAAPNTTIGVITFSNFFRTRLNIFDSPLVDNNGNGTPDLQEMLKSLRAGGGTNFDIALKRVIKFFNQVDSQDKTNLVFFLSDGEWNGTTSATIQLIDPNGINAVITAIGLGQNSSLKQLDLIDDNQVNGSASQVFSPSALTAGLTGGSTTPANINYLEILVDGTARKKSPKNQLSKDLEFTETLTGLSAGKRTITTRVVFDDPDMTNVQVKQTVEVISPTNSQ